MTLHLSILYAKSMNNGNGRLALNVILNVLLFQVLEMVRFLRAASGCVQSLAELCSLVKVCEEKLLPKYVTGFRSSSSLVGGGLYFSRNSESLHGYHSLSTAAVRKRPEARLTRSYATEAQEPRKTSLYDFHVALQGKMVPFGGYLLPVSHINEVNFHLQK
ncbi:hypothetical protein C0J52_21803 [Blattella germanica]|nr:hypothetical protein C0J52_21803 [Blattella germanica]